MNVVLRNIVSSTMLIGTLLSGERAFAAEDGKSVYLLGTTASMAGMTPPPGTYVSSFTYLYSAAATGSGAVGLTLPQNGRALPSTANLQLNADVSVKANVALDVFSMLWVAPQEFLGGQFGVGALLPVGNQTVDVNIDARSALTFPNGRTLARGGSFGVSDNTFAAGDPLAVAFIGWSSGNWHWKLTGLVNVPIGSYNKVDLVSMGFNHWAADLTGSLTWLDPKSGLEVSVAPGITFNGENPDTHYTSGNEFHIEAALMKHFTKDFAIGVAGYYYKQITDDSGSGAVLGPFRGEVAAIGPNLTYNFLVGKVPVLTSIRWLHEFNATNRLEGDAGFFTLTIPLSGAPAH